MAASPSSVAATSDIEPPSSPVGHVGKSFASSAVGEDEDAAMIDATPDPAEKTTRGKSKASQKGDASAGQQIGKIRHLKKEDGEPLWREDIQYDFLRAVFGDTKEVFTNTYDTKLGKQNFADLYIDTMSRSSKTSKVLRDKLLSDRDAAIGMAMVCLLVNVGRMNTTLNCEFLFRVPFCACQHQELIIYCP
jgi:Ino eighty subunit 1